MGAIDICMLMFLSALLTWRSGCEVGSVFLVAALGLMTDALLPQAGTVQFLTVCLLVLSGPLTGALTTFLLQQFADPLRRVPLFTSLGTVGGYAVVLSSPRTFEHLAVIFATPSLFLQGAGLLLLVNQVFLGSVMIAVVLMVLVVLAELPTRLVFRRRQMPLRGLFDSVRVVAVVALLGMSLQFIEPLFFAQTDPKSFAQSPAGLNP